MYLGLYSRSEQFSDHRLHTFSVHCYQECRELHNEDLCDASTEVGLEVNIEKIKLSICSSHHQTTGQNHITKVANKLFGNVAKFKHSGTTVLRAN
jgi:hypothetical protein